MIRKVEMYQAVCDGCGKNHVNEALGYVAWTDEWSAINDAVEDEWQEIDGKLYCPDCVLYDEESDNFIVKTKGGEK